MNWRLVYCICTLLAGCISSQKPLMNISITSMHTLDSIPSGSALVRIGQELIIVTDDAPAIYRFREGTQVFSTVGLEGYEAAGRIPKAVKPDFESGTLGRIDGANHLRGNLFTPSPSNS